MRVELGKNHFNREVEFYPSSEILQHNFEIHPAKEEILAYFEEVRVPLEILFRWPDARGGSLSDIGILRHLVSGNIVISPFDRRLLQSNGYDVRLGEYFYVHEDPNIFKSLENREVVFPYYDRRIPFYNPVDPENVVSAWTGPLRADKAEALFKRFEAQIKVAPPKERDKWKTMRFLQNIDPDDKLIVLTPGALFLGHTLEYIGGKNVVATRISGKSTVGRNMVEVCSDANLGDIGFCSRWTLEITNKSQISAIVLIVGEPIATITFEEIERPLQQYRGRYQQGETPEEIESAWKPEMMLPKWRRLREKSNES